MRRLEGNVAIVTGAGTGSGAAITHTFARKGAKVVVNGLPSDPVHDVVMAIKDHGGDAVVFAGDVANEAEAQACGQTAIETYGQLDVLGNNAGEFLATAELQDYPINVSDETIRMNPVFGQRLLDGTRHNR